LQQQSPTNRGRTIEDLFEQHSEKLFTYLRQHAQSREDAEDILVETFMAALAETKFALESSGQPQNKLVYILKSFIPGTGQLLSEHQLAVGQDNPVTVGASNGLLYLQINVPRRANDISYADYLFVAYLLSDGGMAWRHAMPPFPAPTSANTAPATSMPVLAP
jgi:hypothetical protein